MTDGPFAETTEVLGGYFVLEAADLDAAVDLARQIPTARTGGIEVRPMVQWSAPDDPGTRADAPMWLCTIHGPETTDDDAATDGWSLGAEQHREFAASAGGAIVASGAVHPTSTATTLRERDGRLVLGDGPFSETTEIVGGFYVLSGNRDQVTAIAARVPVHPDGGVELRPIMDLEA